MKLYVITFLSLITIGCKSQKATNNQSTEDIALDSVTIYESGCEGTCPVYTMTIFSDGSSTFNGEAYTKTLGEDTYNFSEESITNLFSDLKHLDFDTFKEKPTQVVDLPETKITYRNKSIIIKDPRHIPESFKTLVTTLKALSRSTGFIN